MSGELIEHLPPLDDEQFAILVAMLDQRVRDADVIEAAWLLTLKVELVRLRAELSSLRGEGGWITGDASGQKWRSWTAFGPVWVEDRNEATRYARRVDAEQVHQADEDAWKVEPFSAHPTTDSDVIGRLVTYLRGALDVLRIEGCCDDSCNQCKEARDFLASIPTPDDKS